MPFLLSHVFQIGGLLVVRNGWKLLGLGLCDSFDRHGTARSIIMQYVYLVRSVLLVEVRRTRLPIE